IGGIQEIHPQLQRPRKGVQGFPMIPWPVKIRHSHTSQTHSRNFEALFSQGYTVHTSAPLFHPMLQEMLMRVRELYNAPNDPLGPLSLSLGPKLIGQPVNPIRPFVDHWNYRPFCDLHGRGYLN